MDIEERVGALERRVAALERTPPVAPGEGEGAGGRDDGGALWALEGIAARVDDPGAALLAGAVTLPDGRAARWQEARTLPDLLATDVEHAADALAALGSPIRLRLLRHLLDAPRTVQALTTVEGVGTTGQVYHHLRQLTATGWVRPLGGGRYEVPVARVVPLLAALLAST